MSELFSQIQSGPNATQIAAQLINNSNVTYMRMRDALQQDFDQFWYRNRDTDGNRALTGPDPTGIEILQALGPQALPLMAIAWARVQFVAACAAAVGSTLDVNGLLPPYELTWNSDGSLAGHSLRA
jgi:hypothetical protein